MATPPVFLDTSFVIALENRADPHHERAKALDRRLLIDGTPLLLHRGILLEIGDGYARLGRRTKGLALLVRLTSEADYLVDPIGDATFRSALDLYANRADKEWGLTDCVSFVLMREHGATEALTADAHFRQAGFTPLLLTTP